MVCYMENRRYPRVEASALIADISDGYGFYSAKIDNFSRFGLRMSELPAKLNSNAELLTAIITQKGKNYKMFLRPKWVHKEGLTKSIGVYIENCSWGWTNFVQLYEHAGIEEATKYSKLH